MIGLTHWTALPHVGIVTLGLWGASVAVSPAHSEQLCSRDDVKSLVVTVLTNVRSITDAFVTGATELTTEPDATYCGAIIVLRSEAGSEKIGSVVYEVRRKDHDTLLIEIDPFQTLS